MVSLDRLFDLLSNERRRYALYYLDRRDGPVSTNELATHVAERQTGATRPSAQNDRFRRTTLEIYHTDLPKAAEAEYIRYEPGARSIELDGPPPEFDAILSLAHVIERSNESQ